MSLCPWNVLCTSPNLSVLIVISLNFCQDPAPPELCPGRGHDGLSPRDTGQEPQVHVGRPERDLKGEGWLDWGCSHWMRDGEETRRHRRAAGSDKKQKVCVREGERERKKERHGGQ